MNEGLFFAHIMLMIALSFVALRYGEIALTGLIALQALLANLFVTKQILLFGWNATCGDVASLGAALGLNLLQEFHGKGAVRRAIYLSMALLLIFLLFSLFQCLYVASPWDQVDGAFQHILWPLLRLGLVSAGVYGFVQLCDRSFFSWLSHYFEKRYPLGRMTLSLLLSQLLDTLLFSFIGLSGMVDRIWEIIGVSLTLKYLMILCTLFCLIPWSRSFYRKETAL